MPGAKKAPRGDTRRRSQRRPYGEHGPGGKSPGRPGDDPGRFVVEESERAGLGVTKRRYGPGEIVFAPGDPDDRLHFLLEGALRTYKTYANSREATTALLKDHGVFGKPALTEGGGQDDFAEAVTEARVAGIRKSAVAGLARCEPDLALALFSALTERLRLSERFKSRTTRRQVCRSTCASRTRIWRTWSPPRARPSPRS